MSDSSTRRRVRRIAIGGVAVLAVIALLLLGPAPLARWNRQTAARLIEAGAINEARRRLEWCGWLQPGDATTDLLRARCFRHLEQVERWEDALNAAEQKGASPTRILQESTLAKLQTGWSKPEVENRLDVLKQPGVSSSELATAFVHGFIRVEEFEKAESTLDKWSTESPDDPALAYMRGIYRQSRGEVDQARTELERGLAMEPRHELARLALAGVLELRNRLDEAFQQYAEVAARAPGSEDARAGMALILLQRGRVDQAREVLEPLVSRPDPFLAVVVTMAEVELVSGNLEEARRRFEQVGLDQTEDYKILSRAGVTFSLLGDTVRAERLLAKRRALGRRSVMSYNLQVRLAIDPGDRKAVEATRRLYRQPLLPPDDAGAAGARQPRQDGHDGPAASGAELYVLHCSSCHGANGDGNGLAARDLFPEPRNLRTGKSRLVSTLNAVPTLEDIEAVIRRGMPGTSMPPFEDLTEQQRKLLAREVLRLNREGVRDQFIDTLVDAGEPIDESEIQEVVELCTTPGDVVDVPDIGRPTPKAIARGREVYFDLGCQKCHGDEGAGDADDLLFDDQGRPSRPRDLIRDPLKGGDDSESMYLRIFAGMPGTPHPACYNVPEQQLIDLVHYCRSLSKEPKRALTNRQRAIRVMGAPNLFASESTAAQ